MNSVLLRYCRPAAGRPRSSTGPTVRPATAGERPGFRRPISSTYVAAAATGARGAAALPQLPALDAIVVPAGGLTTTGSLPEWVRRRMDAALEAHRQTGAPVLCSGGGTPHKPPVLLPGTGYVVHESTACASYLLERGLAPSCILKEWASYDTVRKKDEGPPHRVGRSYDACDRRDDHLFNDALSLGAPLCRGYIYI